MEQNPSKDDTPTAPHHPMVMHHKRQMAMYHRLHHSPAAAIMLPEQEHPIDYHIPKKRDMGPTKRKDINGELIGCEDDEDKRIKKIDLAEEREKRIREAKRAILHRALLQHIRRLPPGSPMVGRLAGIVQAAAGHGRSSSNNSGGQSNASNGASTNGGSGGSINFSGSAGCGNSGAAGGLGGSGAGGNGGRDNRSNYGPNSPPTGSLPPFYESLKGGANGGGLNAYNAQNGMNGNAFNNYLLNSTLAQMDCDANGELTNIGGYPSSPQDPNTKQYSVLQNVYLQNGMVLKDEIDLDYDNKIDTLSLNGNLLQNYGDGYTDSMMADLSNAVDPLQLTATLTFSSPNEHALLESLTDAVDLSQFLQRLPSDDDQCNDLELSSTPSLTPDSNDHHHQQHNHNNMDSFQDHLIGGRNGGFNNNDRQLFYKLSPPSSTSSYENPPPYQNREHNGLHNTLLQQQHHQQQQHMVQNVPNGFDMDSSLPSPSGASHYDSVHSPQQQSNQQCRMPNVNEQPSASTTPSPNAMTTIQNVSKSLKPNNRRVSAACKISNLLASATTSEPPVVVEAKKTHVLQQRVSKFHSGKNNLRNKFDFFFYPPLCLLFLSVWRTKASNFGSPN
jgi:ovo